MPTLRILFEGEAPNIVISSYAKEVVAERGLTYVEQCAGQFFDEHVPSPRAEFRGNEAVTEHGAEAVVQLLHDIRSQKIT